MLNYTPYYDEFLRYFEMAKWQHNNCNLGTIPHEESPFGDDLMKNVYLYDVVERKYAGFGQILLDVMCTLDNHPYKHKMPTWRKELCKSFDTTLWDLPEFLFVFFVHRLTGSAINYAKNPSGYHNSPLFAFKSCDTMDEMIEAYRDIEGPKFSSQGYQIAPFPKVPNKFDYRLGGDYFICELLPKLVYNFSEYLQLKKGRTFREVMPFLDIFNKFLNCRTFWFQYSAVLADIGDFFPELINKESLFFYGKNAIESMGYMAERPRGMKQQEFLDIIAMKILDDTGSVPYNSEDVCCDSIRWIESYINPKADYSHLDMDKIFSSHNIIDHPFGRQKTMLDLGLVSTFNSNPHPSDDKIIKDNSLSVQQYKEKVDDFLIFS